jgi:uncharacterized protein YbjT (DUF2867 family)
MYVITGATGHTGKLIAQQLLEAGKSVKVISRKPENVADLIAKGAEAVIGDLADAAFLTEAFKGATAVYAMIPPKWDVTDWRAFQLELTNSLVKAVKESGVKNVVMLSSQGAHMPEGAGPVSGLYYLEQGLKEIPGINVLALRPGFFMENLYGNMGLMKQAGIWGYSMQPDLKMPFVHTRDIAAIGAQRLLALDFKGFSHQFIAGAADLSMTEVADTLNKGLGTQIPYFEFSKEDAFNGMVQAGIPATIAHGYGELFDALNSSEYQVGYTRSAENTTPTTLEWFVENEFKHAWNA